MCCTAGALVYDVSCTAVHIMYTQIPGAIHTGKTTIKNILQFLQIFFFNSSKCTHVGKYKVTHWDFKA